MAKEYILKTWSDTKNSIELELLTSGDVDSYGGPVKYLEHLMTIPKEGEPIANISSILYELLPAARVVYAAEKIKRL